MQKTEAKEEEKRGSDVGEQKARTRRGIWRRQEGKDNKRSGCEQSGGIGEKKRRNGRMERLKGEKTERRKQSGAETEQMRDRAERNGEEASRNAGAKRLHGAISRIQSGVVRNGRVRSGVSLP